ncbi:hypothetical protein NDU88_005120 [Pleurodeles waltl]|uniref:Uncharacterized protein n=1 Tax=Pleurodeles waltl TaxID=8319 RepID=A0AAV7VJ12_PLEWA|nr:hypothetical protein NDU88_005120 [Pleurodeles waltl]
MGAAEILTRRGGTGGRKHSSVYHHLEGISNHLRAPALYRRDLEEVPSPNVPTPLREPAARSSSRPGPTGAAAKHLRQVGRGATPDHRPPGIQARQPDRQKVACSKRGLPPPALAQICGPREPTAQSSRRESPVGCTAPVPKSNRDDFTPQGQGKVYSGRAIPAAPTLSVPTQGAGPSSRGLRAPHAHKAQAQGQACRRALQHVTRSKRRPVASPSPTMPSQAVLAGREAASKEKYHILVPAGQRLTMWLLSCGTAKPSPNVQI